MEDFELEAVPLEDDGTFPNNPAHPLLLYRQAVPADPTAVEALFSGNGWPSAWRDGVYPFHHYHSTAHEVLGVYAGDAVVQFGGEGGRVARLRAGDVVVIPAGVAHKRLEAQAGFAAVGAYPAGQSRDMCYGRPEERPAADRRIAALPEPGSDPVAGPEGPLARLWKPEP